MGLDSVELLMSVEDAFEIRISDQDAATFVTPRLLIDHVFNHLPSSDAGPVLLQRAFYRVRKAIALSGMASSSAVHPDALLNQLLPEPKDHSWQRLRIELHAREWPRLGHRRGLEPAREPHLSTVGELAAFMVERNPTALITPGESWTRKQVAEVVHRLIGSETGATDYRDDSHFRRDMGVY